MPATASLVIRGEVLNLPGGTLTVGPLSIASVAATAQRFYPFSLVVGNNTFTGPSGAKAVLFVPPPANAIAITLKGAGGDTGVRISPSQPILLALDTTFTTIVLSVGTQVDGCDLLWM